VTILDRYIIRALLQWTLVALVVLVSLRVFITFVDESGDAGVGDFSVFDALLVTLLKTPGFVVEVFPVGALVGGLLALGGMARNAELIAIRSAGVSVWRIIGSVMMGGAVLVVLVVMVSELAAPAFEQRAEMLKAERMNQPSVLHTRHGYWIREGSRFVNIRKVFPPAGLGDVFIYELDEDWRLRSALYAREGEYLEGHWVLTPVYRLDIGPEGVARSSEQEWVSPLGIKPQLLNLVSIKPAVMSGWDLYQYISFLAANDQSRPEYEVALWSKVTVPVTTLILLVLSVAFVLGNLRSVDVGQRVLAGAVTGTLFFILNRSASFVSLVYDVPPVLAAWVPALVFLTITLVYLNRTTGHLPAPQSGR